MPSHARPIQTVSQKRRHLDRGLARQGAGKAPLPRARCLGGWGGTVRHTAQGGIQGVVGHLRGEAIMGWMAVGPYLAYTGGGKAPVTERGS